MNWLMSYFSSSVGKKNLMGLTGISLAGFLIVHLLGNLTMLHGAQAFNTYSHTLMSLPIIYFAELALLALFIFHIFTALTLVIQNRNARSESYYMKVKTGNGATFASSTMPYTGSIILIFLITHLFNFKYGAHYTVSYDGIVMRDLFTLMIEYFAKPLNVAWYIIAMIAAGIHTSHGLWSGLQTFGINNPKYNGFIKIVSIGYAFLISFGFSAFAIWAYLQGGNV